MRTRQEIQSEINAGKEAIKNLMAEIRKEEEKVDLLEIEKVQVCDDISWYKEGPETHTYGKGKKKTVRTNIFGRKCWKENYTDEDTKEVITINREMIVRIDGEWKL